MAGTGPAQAALLDIYDQADQRHEPSAVGIVHEVAIHVVHHPPQIVRGLRVTPQQCPAGRHQQGRGDAVTGYVTKQHGQLPWPRLGRLQVVVVVPAGLVAVDALPGHVQPGDLGRPLWQQSLLNLLGQAERTDQPHPLFQPRDHLVDHTSQLAQLIAATDVGADRQVALGYSPRRVGQVRNWPRHRPRHEQRYHNHQHDHDRQHDPSQTQMLPGTLQHVPLGSLRLGHYVVVRYDQQHRPVIRVADRSVGPHARLTMVRHAQQTGPASPQVGQQRPRLGLIGALQPLDLDGRVPVPIGPDVVALRDDRDARHPGFRPLARHDDHRDRVFRPRRRHVNRAGQVQQAHVHARHAYHLSVRPV